MRTTRNPGLNNNYANVLNPTHNSNPIPKPDPDPDPTLYNSFVTLTPALIADLLPEPRGLVRLAG